MPDPLQFALQPSSRCGWWHHLPAAGSAVASGWEWLHCENHVLRFIHCIQHYLPITEGEADEVMKKRWWGGAVLCVHREKIKDSKSVRLEDVCILSVVLLINTAINAMTSLPFRCVSFRAPVHLLYWCDIKANTCFLCLVHLPLTGAGNYGYKPVKLKWATSVGNKRSVLKRCK